LFSSTILTSRLDFFRYVAERQQLYWSYHIHILYFPFTCFVALVLEITGVCILQPEHSRAHNAQLGKFLTELQRDITVADRSQWRISLIAAAFQVLQSSCISGDLGGKTKTGAALFSSWQFSLPIQNTSCRSSTDTACCIPHERRFRILISMSVDSAPFRCRTLL
jgi:hypothetical protein